VIPLLLTLSTLCQQVQLLHPEVRDTVTITATLVQYKIERDGDVHLILEDSGCTMIAEVDRAHRSLLPHKATTHWRYFGKRVTVTGIGCKDHEHGQVGAAPNGRELHPVLSMLSGNPCTGCATQ
jgi:hypothetical protein